MKIFKLICVVAAIGIGLWTSTLHAQNLRSRTVDLDCVPDIGVSFCGAGTARAKSLQQVLIKNPTINWSVS